MPLENIASVDACFAHKKQAKISTSVSISGLPYLALSLQIVLMYLGTVFHRTTDLFGWHVTQSEWLPPQLSAAHNALSGSFATRSYWLPQLIRSNATLSRNMTILAMVGELGCLLAGTR
ncbi:MAG: hypothetical protein ACRDL7_05575 [Gaiellaceae bacterium]